MKKEIKICIFILSSIVSIHALTLQFILLSNIGKIIYTDNSEDEVIKIDKSNINSEYKKIKNTENNYESPSKNNDYKVIINPEDTHNTPIINDDLPDINTDDTYKSSSSSDKDTYIAPPSNKELKINSVEHGELLSVYQDEGLVIIKAKIDYSYSKKSTIEQNGFNIEHIIKDNDMKNINEILYWAVADMGGSYDEKVIRFTVNKNLINRVKNGSVTGDYIVDEASDVWIHISLI